MAWNKSHTQVPIIKNDLDALIEGEVRDDQVFRYLYSTDASIYQIMPTAVVIPKDIKDISEVVKYAGKNGLEFIILKDPNNTIADRFNAKYTPEIFVLNSDLNILYHGRIDDSRKESNVESMDLRVALDEILEGQEVSVTETKAFGCTIKRVDK